MDYDTDTNNKGISSPKSLLSANKSMRIKALYAIAIITSLVLVIIYFTVLRSSNKIEPHSITRKESFKDVPLTIVTAQRMSIGETYEAVGTIRPRTETTIDAQVTGRILNVHVRSGDYVKKGDRLVTLEDNEYRTRLEGAKQGLLSAGAQREQAKQSIESAQAVFDRTESQYKRVLKLFEDNVLSTKEREQSESEFLQARAELTSSNEGLDEAEAGVRQARNLVEEAEIFLNYTEIRATEDTEIARRLVEPGDLAVPGKTLLIAQTVGAMRLEANVREGLIRNIQRGRELNVSIEAIEKEVTGFVEEIVPSADPKTRSFLVKVGLPYIKDLYPGMFGRLFIPSGTREAVLIPADTVIRVGQLETVLIIEDGSWRRVFIKTGRRFNNMIEVLSGLNGDETIGIFERDHD